MSEEAKAAAFVQAFRKACQVTQTKIWSKEQMRLWQGLYRVMVDHDAGLRLLAELERLRERNRELEARPDLFQHGKFTLASGKVSEWKIECDALSPFDWETLALLLKNRLPPFGAVEGVPKGGIPLAKAMEKHATSGPLLLTDDVWTSGGSWNRCRNDRDVIGAVVFARNPTPPEVVAFLNVTPEKTDE